MSKKTGRLALKKKTGLLKNDDKTACQSTILSMFKNQTRKDDKDHTVRPVSSSGSESDLIITGVTQQKAEVKVNDHKQTQQNSANRYAKGTGSDDTKTDKKRGRLSLSKRNKTINSFNSYSSAKDEADITTGKRKRGDIEPNACPTPYKLRKHETVPVIEIASEDESDRTGDIEAEYVQAMSDLTEDSGDGGSVYKDKQKTNKVRNRKAKLKRSKTDSKLHDLKARKRLERKLGRHELKTKETIKSSKSSCSSVKQSDSNTLQEEDSSEKTLNKNPEAKKPMSYTKIKTPALSESKETASCIDLTESPQKNKLSPMHGSRIGKDRKDTYKNKAADSGKKTDIKSLKQGTLKHMFIKHDSSTNSKSKNKANDFVKCSDKDKTFKAHLSNSLDTESNTEIKSDVNDKRDSVTKDGDHEKDFSEANKDDSDADEVPEEKTEVVYRVPYYLENFRTILDSVLNDKENSKLFNENDMTFISAFNQLTEPCQKLYVRIFSRKLAWLPMSKLKYPEISDNIPDLVDKLQKVGLLQYGNKLNDLDIVLKILAAPDLKLLAKSFHINSSGTKDKLVELLLKKSQENSIGTMFTGGKGLNTGKAMLSRAKGYLGKVCRLDDSCRAVFIRVLMLFSLYNTNFDEDSGGGGQNQLFQMLMANIGRVVYPSYTVDRQRAVFQDRGALVRFETALQFELDLQSEIEKSRWKQAHEVYQQAQTVGSELKKDKSILKWDRSLPEFLRLYTARSVYVRIDSLGVEVLQRLRKYNEAVTLLEELLDQDIYCNHYRGHWYERLALNLDAHLKSQQRSLDVIQRGLLDIKVHTGRRLALYERAKKICEAPKSKFADKMALFEHDVVLPTPEVCIEGMVISDASSMGMKYQFIMSGDTDQTTLCAVEELVLEHYKNNGYPEGLHAEGSIISNLFMMFFWDVMFMPVPDVFHGPFQTCPLDWHTHDFYKNRTEAVDQRLGWLEQADEDELVAAVEEVWEKHNGEICTGISWDKFTGPETLQGLVGCMGGKVIAGIMDRFVKNPRHTRSGFPDLTLWNTETKAFKICEVKGPNDRLSNKQILWIDYLQKLGVDAEVCYVKAVGSKRLKPTSSRS